MEHWASVANSVPPHPRVHIVLYDVYWPDGGGGHAVSHARPELYESITDL